MPGGPWSGLSPEGGTQVKGGNADHRRSTTKHGTHIQIKTCYERHIMRGPYATDATGRGAECMTVGGGSTVRRNSYGTAHKGRSRNQQTQHQANQ